MNRASKESSASNSTGWHLTSQRRVLEFTRTLAGPTIPAVSGGVTARFAGAIPDLGVTLDAVYYTRGRMSSWT
jgi:hypothetical protein